MQKYQQAGFTCGAMRVKIKKEPGES